MTPAAADRLIQLIKAERQDLLAALNADCVRAQDIRRACGFADACERYYGAAAVLEAALDALCAHRCATMPEVRRWGAYLESLADHIGATQLEAMFQALAGLDTAEG